MSGSFDDSGGPSFDPFAPEAASELGAGTATPAPGAGARPTARSTRQLRAGERQPVDYSNATWPDPGGGGGNDGPGELDFDLSGGASGASLPAATRGRAEASLGVDLGAVRVHTDADAAQSASALSAQAYTSGNDIFFGAGRYQPGSAQGDHLIAHELVHVAQQASGGAAMQRQTLAVTQIDEPAEHEADRGADAILAGTPFAVREQPTGIPREALAGNPAERTDATGTATTAHRTPGVADAANAPTTAAPTTAARNANIRLLATATAPLHFDAAFAPLPERIYEEGPAVSPAPAGFTAVTEIRGSVDAPVLEQIASPAVFIGGAPSGDDVQQGGIGDCYLMATLIGMATRDPGKVTSMVAPDGRGGATVNLWRRETAVVPPPPPGTPPPAPTFTYVPVAVAVSADLAVNVTGGAVHGAQLRCSPLPRSQDYWGAFNSTALEVHRKDLYEVARWAPLVEKACARFAQQHGQYGGAVPGEGNASGGSGYEGINGGVAMHALHVFYGAAADAPGALTDNAMTAVAPVGSNILAANAAVVDQLILLEGHGAAAAPGDTSAPILTVNTYPDAQVTNLQAAITAAQADPDWATVSADRQTKILAVQTAITAWNALPADPPAPAAQPKATALAAVGNAAVEVTRTPNPDHLAETRSHNPTPITFASGANTVDPAQTGTLNFLGQWLEYVINVGTLVPFAVTMVGHSSSDGSEESNQTLSEERARAVSTAIQAGGTPANMGRHTFAASGVGETGATGDAAWRRVDIAIDHQSGANELFADIRSPAIRAMMDLMLNVRNLGTDSSTGQRNVYAGHSYSVLSVSFLDTAGRSVSLGAATGAARTALLPTVDPIGSRVGLRNPHHGNEPDRLGTGAATRPEDGAPSGVAADGVFQMNLDEFFRNFNSLQSGVFPRTP